MKSSADVLDSPGFCPAPWTSIYIDPAGAIDNCCISHNELGNINHDRLDATISGYKNLAVKRHMLAGSLPGGCQSCANQPGQANTLRKEYIKWFDHVPKSLYQPDESFDLRYLDLRWRNTCNFACVYCDSTLSSSWAKELGQWQKITPDGHVELHDYVLENLANLDYLYLAGGEPLLINENKQVLEKLLLINPGCEIRVNTNLSQVDNDIFRLLKQFDRVHWIVSAEATGEKYDYIRYGGSWNQFRENLALLKPLGHEVTFNMVYLALNTQDVFNCIDEIARLGFDPNTATVLYYNLGNGGPLDPRNLPAPMIEQAQETLTKRIDPKQEFLSNGLTVIADTLKKIYYNDQAGFPSLVEYLRGIDQRRNLDSRKIFPEVYSQGREYEMV